MAPALIGAIASGVSVATGLASGIAKMATSNDQRPKLTGMSGDVATNLANQFAHPITGVPQLGQGLGSPSMPQGAPNLADIRQRLGGLAPRIGG